MKRTLIRGCTFEEPSENLLPWNALVPTAFQKQIVYDVALETVYTHRDYDLTGCSGCRDDDDAGGDSGGRLPDVVGMFEGQGDGIA